MREVFVSELVKNVLGPRHGPNEILAINPVFEYVTGILAPAGPQDHDPGHVVPEEDTSRINQDDQYNEDLGEVHPTAPALDPKNIPSTMGVSFFVKSGNPRFKICVTWARYSRGDKGWTRKPHHNIFEEGGHGNRSRPLNAEPENRILFFYNAKPVNGTSETSRISLFVENNMSAERGTEQAERYVFQPQIRVVCSGDTKLVQGFRAPSLSSKDAESDLVYRGRPFLAKGHLTSALWKDVDPERDPCDAGISESDAAEYPPFRWTDGDRLPAADRDLFSPPDVRTEYVPVCSVSAPDMDWTDNGRPPVLEAATLAGSYDPERLYDAVRPVADEYDSWIGRVQKDVSLLPEGLQVAAKKIVAECREVHRRIVSGMETLRDDDDARLAFCFANKAIDLQYSWTKGEPMKYRPFQLAFILATLESVVNPDSRDRNTCDLLWVPTGAGKTEAYLAVVAMILAYRRLVRRGGQSAAGVSVITRYTLRLLTIQQFRRTLSVISAAEYLRVSGLEREEPAGWRPAGCPRADDFLWGPEPFSAGLWVGKSLTPNRLESKWWKSNGKSRMSPGAIDMLKGKAYGAEGDPAQITECPACSCILAVPDDGLEAGRNLLHFVVSSGDLAEGAIHASVPGRENLEIAAIRCTSHRNQGFFTVIIDTTSASPVKPDEVANVWSSLKDSLESEGIVASLCSASPTRPGYFVRSYIKSGGRNPTDYDFDIFCPNPSCPMRTKWVGGSPSGRIHERSAGVAREALLGGTFPEDVITPFQDGPAYMSDRIPIKAFTVDEQVYRGVPSVVVATVDKFARLPFEPKAGNMFGNVSCHHCLWGYARRPDGTVPWPSAYVNVRWLGRPDVIIQDELHLIEGPLGSMVGAYESAVDFLSSGGGPPVKYIASTATISNPEDHVRSVMNRGLMLFPPVGINGDRFFMREKQAHPLDDRNPGRLYAGVCCPGKGPLTPIVRLWAGLSQTAYENRDSPEIDRFWTLTGYFNSVRELAGARALYRQDIPERIHVISADPRELDFDSSIELSSRTASARLPSILNRLNKEYPDSPAGLFATSMFGTGVDVPRIGLMLVNGQPKTTTSYIQSTGRVGRRRGALVVTFLRASRPRDLNHYEFFLRHHQQMHRFVEPVTVHPFSSGVLDGALGPVALGMLRNMQTDNPVWGSGDARAINDNRGAVEIAEIERYLSSRSANQPKERMPPSESVAKHLASGWDRWESVARDEAGIAFHDYQGRKDAVVLGGQQNRRAKVVFRNAPQSLRELEDEAGFQA